MSTSQSALTRVHRSAPRYTVADVSRFIHVPAATVRSWVVGREYPLQDTTGFFEPVIRPAGGQPLLLSFDNLVEAHVVRALTKLARTPVRIATIRTAIDYASQALQIERLLLDQALAVGGGELFLERFGELVNLNRTGQIAAKQILGQYLERIIRGPDGLPDRLFPFIDHETPSDSIVGRAVVIDPSLSFGRPVVNNGYVPTSIIIERLDAGEDIDDLAQDYQIARELIEGAVLYERAA